MMIKEKSPVICQSCTATFPTLWLIAGADECDRTTERLWEPCLQRRCSEATAQQNMPETEGQKKWNEDDTADSSDFIFFFILPAVSHKLYLLFFTYHPQQNLKDSVGFKQKRWKYGSPVVTEIDPCFVLSVWHLHLWLGLVFVCC